MSTLLGIISLTYPELAGVAEIKVTSTVENSTGNDITTAARTIKFNFINISQMINQLFSFAELSKLNLLVELNRLDLKRDTNIDTATNSLHDTVYATIEDKLKYSNTLMFEKDLLKEANTLYDISILYDDVSMDRADADSYYAQTTRKGS